VSIRGLRERKPEPGEESVADLRGQADGQPVWRLLEGTRRSCPTFANGMFYSSPALVAERAAALLDNCCRRTKTRIGYGWDHDRGAVRSARRAIRDGSDLLAHGMQRFDLATARRMAKYLAAQRALRFEERFEPQDIDDDLARHHDARLPIAAGESEFGFEGLRELIRVGAVDIVPCDAGRCGGSLEVREGAALAARAGRRGTTRGDAGPARGVRPLAVVATAHEVAACENGLTVEIDQTGNRFVEELLVRPLAAKEGLLDLGEEPRLAIALGPAAVSRWRLAPLLDPARRALRSDVPAAHRDAPDPGLRRTVRQRGLTRAITVSAKRRSAAVFTARSRTSPP